MKKILSIFLLGFLLVNLHAQRGRVQIQDGTLVTDRGTLLRGAFISIDSWDYIPGEDQISAIKELGLNSVHLYGECRVNYSPGENYPAVDSIVNMTERDSLYLVLTIGGCGEEGSFDSAFVNDFWKFYAPRYKDKTHVIYEIMNEPFAWEPPYDSATIAMERRAYDTIRYYAPESHVLFMSYSGARNAQSAVQDIKNLGEGIDWSNASIATHGYGVASEELRSFMNTIIDSGYAIINTEPVSVGNRYANMATTRVFEEEFISYLHFVYIPTLLDEEEVYVRPFEQSEIRWTPDFGTWPASLTEIDYRDPFEEFDAGFYDEGSGFDLLHLDTRIGYINDEDYIAYYNFNFEESPDLVVFRASCDNESTGRILMYLDSLDGTLIGDYPIPYTGDWDNYQDFSFVINTTFSGVHKFYLVFHSNQEYDFMNLESIQFKQNEVSSVNESLYSGDGGVKIYPNPAHKYLTIQSSEGGYIEIWSMQGQLVYTEKISNTEQEVYIGHLKAGNYVIKVISPSAINSEILFIK